MRAKQQRPVRLCNALWRHAADRALVIIENGLLFFEPGAELGAVRAHDLMRLTLVPPRQGAWEHLSLGERDAPHISMIAAVIELDGNRKIIMRGEGIFAYFRW